MHKLIKTAILLSIGFVGGTTIVHAQNPFWEAIKKQPATLGVDQGVDNFSLTNLNLGILKSSQTVASLKLKDDNKFDYTPDELLTKRDRDKFFHLGDINLSIRPVGTDGWTAFSSAKSRQQVKPLGATGKVLAAADISASLGDIPLQVVRNWENINGDLCLRFTITNNTAQDYEIGALGIPMIFNNNMDWKNLDTAHADNVFFDPYIGKDAGYIQINRLHGNGPSLLVIPQENASFEAYNPLNSDPTPRSITFEGFHEWLIHSKALAETEWKGVEQWNTPTSTVLRKGQSTTYAVRFTLAPSIRQIEETLVQQQRPVAIGAPGYVVPTNNPAKLFIQYAKKIKSIDVFPTGALTVEKLDQTKNKWQAYQVKGNQWGRARLTITYVDGLVQTIQYKVIKPEQEVVNDLGQFLTTTQWYENPNDLFGRSPSVISYDYETKKLITEEQRAWYAGLSDEAGAASWLAAIMKQVVQPNPQEIQKLKRFVNETMYGRIQHKEGKDQYGVVKSLFYYEPDSMPKGTYSESINYKTWSAWPKKEADNIGRSYNYPHVAAAHWVMYRLARNYQGLVTEEAWQTYLDRACQTAIAMVEKAPYYAQFGQMEGSIFLLILLDMKKEGLTNEAAKLEEVMKKRALHWKSLNYPFGSEMPWDSTGQEEVYVWSRYFGFDDKATVTLNAILAYMPTVPHWGYNGSARRYWDFVYGGKLSRIERQLHHYGSALNAIPVLTEYRQQPQDFYLLRVGHAGTLGALANVTEDGFGPAAFHSYPSTLANDGISGDYGTGFYGYAVNAGTYIFNHPEFGWLAFSGNLKQSKEKIDIAVTTASRGRVFLAAENLWLTADAGEIANLSYHPKNKTVELQLGTPDKATPSVLLHINPESKYTIDGLAKDPQGRYVIPASTTKVTLRKI
ncbi:DUF5695 domain-containing protein [Sphingobacterium psychroaquaticum]|uniref:Uncharacterized protein n=1 Tax=Sphingobacterium psychroaquaticum TaxID=561061 RepID=A0A1X7I5W8_9SPHI|nr:DUF5695 domain-containing protein [Sphingobacterium psychroaquaticum]QBQ41927.1 hypothetical protein E2P86_12500 [Sphingobacterium psychroaquaticum]SMG09260.1 hypothetical protein SAMN05660862_0447 [Sphingobacterium psychroaquaticum]